MDYERLLEPAIETKLQSPPKPKFSETYTTRIQQDAVRVSKLFNEKIEADLKRLGLR